MSSPLSLTAGIRMHALRRLAMIVRLTAFVALRNMLRNPGHEQLRSTLNQQGKWTRPAHACEADRQALSPSSQHLAGRCACTRPQGMTTRGENGALVQRMGTTGLETQLPA